MINHIRLCDWLTDRYGNSKNPLNPLLHQYLIPASICGGLRMYELSIKIKASSYLKVSPCGIYSILSIWQHNSFKCACDFLEWCKNCIYRVNMLVGKLLELQSKSASVVYGSHLRTSSCSIECLWNFPRLIVDWWCFLICMRISSAFRFPPVKNSLRASIVGLWEVHVIRLD